MTEIQGFAIRLMQGASLSQTTGEGEEMGRGTGSFWATGTVRVLTSELEMHFSGKHVVAIMEVPEEMLVLSDEALIKRFINGFNGGKS